MNDTPQQSWWQRLSGGLKRTSASIGGAISDLVSKRRLDAATIEELEELLIRADLGVDVAHRIAAAIGDGRYDRQVSDTEVKAILSAEVEKVLDPVAKPLAIDPAAKPFVILVVGVNGSGKTTTIGKLAARCARDGQSVLLAAGDTFRAAAIEQLKVWAERSGAAFAAQQPGADPGAVVFDALQAAKARDCDVLLADTAGRLHSQSHLMEELKKVRRVLARVDPSAPHEVLLVLDANQGQNALAQARQFKEAVGVTGLVLTKLDGTAKGGIVIAIAQQLGIPIRYIGIGETSEDFGEFDAEAFAAALVEGPQAHAGGEAGTA
jgi:fused signal recognition particle receptor